MLVMVKSELSSMGFQKLESALYLYPSNTFSAAPEVREKCQAMPPLSEMSSIALAVMLSTLRRGLSMKSSLGR